MTTRLYDCEVEEGGAEPGTRSGRVDLRLTTQAQPGGHVDGEIIHRGNSVTVRRGVTGYHFAYGDATEFLVSPAGDVVQAFTPAGATAEDTRTYFVGPVMGWVLRLRGLVCLHASTVVIGNHAVAFCGHPGAGKSTTAAAFAERGYPVLAEDIAALDDCGDSFFVRPGYPRVNLWPDSAAALRGSADALPAITPNWGKRFLPLEQSQGGFQSVRAPLAAVYVIGERREQAEPEIRSIESVEALIALASNTYTPYLLDEPMRAREFDVLTRLVRHVPIRSLRPPNTFTGIDRLCAGILRDFEAIS